MAQIDRNDGESMAAEYDRCHRMGRLVAAKTPWQIA